MGEKKTKKRTHQKQLELKPSTKHQTRNAGWEIMALIDCGWEVMNDLMRMISDFILLKTTSSVQVEHLHPLHHLLPVVIDSLAKPAES